jgi:hypothetical protein
MKHPPVLALHPRCTPDHVGFIPTFLDMDDPRPPSEQFQEQHVGGWRASPRLTAPVLSTCVSAS